MGNGVHRFGAARGTITTTSKHSKGTRDATFEPCAAPIRVLDGNKPVDLLNAEAFAEVEESPVDHEGGGE